MKPVPVKFIILEPFPSEDITQETLYKVFERPYNKIIW